MLTFYRVMVWLTLYCHIYYVWSKLHRLLFDRKYDDTRLPLFDKLDALETVVGKMVWRRDGWRSLWDAICTPQAAWAKFRMGKPAGDCDDISVFALSRLVNMASRGELVYLGVQPWGQKCNIGLLSVPWFDKGSRKTGGHNVAVMKYVDRDSGEDRWAHMSNWYSGKMAWGFESLEQVVKNVCGGKASLGWALADLNLKRWRYGRGSKI